MKKIVLILIPIALASNLFAQQSAVEEVFKKYNDTNGYTSIYLSEHMFNLFSQLDSPAEFDMAGISEMSILVKENQEHSDEFFLEVNSSVQKSKLKEVLSVKTQKEQYSAFVLEVDGIIHELLFFTGGTTNLLLFARGDNINLTSLAKVSAQMNLRELEVLEQLTDF